MIKSKLTIFLLRILEKSLNSLSNDEITIVANRTYNDQNYGLDRLSFYYDQMTLDVLLEDKEWINKN